MATINDLEGGSELSRWFGATPSFHDATLTHLELRQGDVSRLVARTFQMGAEIDAKGYFVRTKLVTVTFTLFDLIAAELYEFAEAAIIDGLGVTVDEDGTTLEFGSSYGVHGRVKARRVVVTFTPDT